MESLININSNNQITTSWDVFRPPDVYPDADLTEFTYSNGGALSTRSVATKFYADLASSSYDLTTIKYFKSPIDTQVNIVNEATLNRWGDVPSPDYSVSYRYVNEFSAITNMKIYEPLLHSANTEQTPIYIIFKGTDSLYDLYTDASIVLNHTVSSYFSSFDSEILSIYNTIKTWISSQSRPLHLIGHSLGGMYALRLLYLLHNQEAPNLDFIEDTYKMTIFNPLLVHNNDIDYFRSVAKRQYAKDNITIHSVKFDFLNPLMAQAGIGSVISYDEVDEPNTVNATDFLLSTWLTQALGISSRTSYLNADNHKITNFVSNSLNAIALSPIQLIESVPLPVNLSLTTFETKLIHKRTPTVGYVSKNLFLYDNELNSNSGVSYIDYPHDDTIHESHSYLNYNWGITTPPDIDTYSQYVLSSFNSVNYINFKLTFTSQTSPIAKVITRLLVKQSATEYMLMTGSYSSPIITCIKSNNNVELLDDAIVCLSDNVSVYYATGTQQANKNRFLWNINAPLLDPASADVASASHVSNRRSEIYSGLLNHFPSPSTNVAYANIKWKTTGLYWFNESTNNSGQNVSGNKTTYAVTPPQGEGNWGMSHLDNTTLPTDEHIWKITHNNGNYTISNSLYPTHFINQFDDFTQTDMSNTQSGNNELSITLDSNNDTTINLIGTSQNYQGYYRIYNIPNTSNISSYLSWNPQTGNNSNFSITTDYKVTFEFLS